jgi:hypothetical protein
LGAEVTELKSNVKLGQIDSVYLNEVRSAKAKNTFTPLTALGELNLPNLIAEAHASLTIKQEHSDAVRSLRVSIPASAFNG